MPNSNDREFTYLFEEVREIALDIQSKLSLLESIKKGDEISERSVAAH